MYNQNKMKNLEDIIDAINNNIKKQSKELEEVKQQLEQVKKDDFKFVPIEGQNYYPIILTLANNCVINKSCDNINDINSINNYNAFETLKEAEEFAEFIKLNLKARQVMKYVNEGNLSTITLNNKTLNKYGIFYYSEEQHIKIDSYFYSQYSHLIFVSREKALKFIDLMGGEEVIKQLFKFGAY